MLYTNDQKLFCGDNGIGIVLMHGVTSGSAQMIPLGRMLNDYGYTVRCVNIAGHGTYPQELLRTSWEDAIDKAWYDYDFMKDHFDKVYLGGFSMGGCLALALASRRDDIDGVISMSAPLMVNPESIFAGGFSPEQIYYHRDPGGKQGTARRYHIHYEEIATRIFDELSGLIACLNGDGVLERIRCPAFVSQALDDEVAMPFSGKKIYDRLSSANKYLYEAQTAGHSMPLNEGRYELMRHLVPWLDRMDGILG